VPIGIMRAPQAILAVSLACEYLDDRLTADTRSRWIRAMGTKGIEPCYSALQGMRYPDQVEGWDIDPESTYFKTRPEHRAFDRSNWPRIFSRNNLRAVPTNGLMTGLVTYRRVLGADRNTDRWLEQARHSFATLGALYAPDGAYDEGVSYSGYTSTQMADLIRHFEWMDGARHFECVNWRGNAVFLLEMSAPTSAQPTGIVSFSDGPTPPPPAVSMWVAHRLQDCCIQWYAVNRTSPPEVRALMRFDPVLKLKEPAQGLSLYQTDFDWIVGRSGYQADDLVCAMRSGPPSNHEHADRNSLFLKCWGEVLLPDPAPVAYSFLEPSWPMRFTSAHNAILIDGEGHQYVDGLEGTNASSAHAHVIDTRRKGRRMQWSSDATRAYQLVNADVRSVVRTVVVNLDTPLIVVADKVVKKTAPSSIQARFLVSNEDGKATFAISRHCFQIRRPEARLEALAFTSGGVSIRNCVLDVGEEKSRAHPVIEVSTGQSLAPYLISILLPVRSGKAAPVIAARIEDTGRHSFAVTSDTGRAVFTADLNGSEPLVEFSQE
jgi:hypothetical protein